MNTEWKPIDTAPTDKRVLVYVPIKHHRLVIAVLTHEGLWLNEGYRVMPHIPSHWMELPEPPQEEGES